MSYKLNTSVSLESLRSYAVQVIAGLKATGGLEESLASWSAQKEAILRARDARDADLDREAETSARVRVSDAEWDSTVGSLSQVAQFLAGGDAKKPPYTELFGTVKAHQLKRFGPAKAPSAAAGLVAKAQSSAHPQLVEAGRELAAKTEALAVAEKADADAEVRVLTHTIEKAKLVRSMETLVAETEAKLLARWPGRDDLVRAILDPTPEKQQPRSAAAPDASEEDVAR